MLRLVFLSCGLIVPLAAFTVYDCMNPETVISYDLTSPPICDQKHAGLVERTLSSEIVQMKETTHIKAYSCYLVVTTTAQHCGMFSHAGIAVHRRFRQVVPIEAQLCRNARATKTIVLDGKVFNITENVRNYFQSIVGGSFNMKKLTCQGNDDGLVIINDYEGFFGEKTIVAHRVTNTVTIQTIGGNLAARLHDESLRDSEFGTYIWEFPNLHCPDSMISLYRGQLLVKTNTSSNPNLIGGVVIVDVNNGKESQVAALELEEQMSVCGVPAYKTHIKDIIYIPHADKDMRVGNGKFEDRSEGNDVTRLETALSFQVIREMDKTNEVIDEIRAEICENRVKITVAKMDEIAAGNNPYAAMRLFGRGHHAIASASVAYVSKCRAVDVRVNKENLKNCTLEIPVIYKNTSYFVNPINNILQKYPTTRICSSIAPPRYLIAGKWYCGYPEILECTAPHKIGMESVKIDDLSYGALHFGDSLYSKEMLDTFEQLAQAEFGRKAFLTDSAHEAMAGQIDGDWGSGLSQAALGSIVDHIGGYFIPFYSYLGKPALFIVMAIMVLSWAKVIFSVALRAIVIAKERGCGSWLFAGLCGTLFYLAISPARIASKIVDDAVADAFGPKPGNHDVIIEMDERKAIEDHQSEKESVEGSPLYPKI